MAGLKLKDNVFADLNDTIGTGDSRSSATFALASGHGARLPTLDANDLLYLDLINTAGQIERWFIHSVSTDDVVATGEQGGTTAKAFAPGDRVEIRWHSLHAAEKENLAGLSSYVTIGGSADALTATLVTRLPALVHGMRVRGYATAANTATATFNLTLDGTSLGAPSTVVTGAKGIVDVHGNPIPGPGGIVGSGHLLDFCYNAVSEKWLLLDAKSPAPAVTTLTSGTGTYATPSGTRLYVKMAGGGGGAQGTAGGGSGASGGATTLSDGTSTSTAGGGAGGGLGSTGGAASGGGLISGLALTGGSGSPSSAAPGFTPGADGGNNAGFGGGGRGGGGNGGAGTAGIANTGGGGGGPGGISGVTGASNGGGAGGYLEGWIAAPAAVLTYAIGTGGAGGSAGSGGGAGQAGAAGVMYIMAIGV